MLPLKQKINILPEDFIVEEVIEIPPLRGGSYAYYLLKKQNCSTFEVVQDLSKRLHIPRNHINFSGLKDRRAITTQYISIKEGVAKDIEGTRRYRLSYLGHGEKPILLGQATGNIFTITLKKIDSEKIKKKLFEAEKIGIPNYFGEQRFAGELYSSRPIATYLIKKDYESALKEHLCHHPDSEVRERLRRYWDIPEILLSESKKVHSRIDQIALKVYLKKRDPEKALRALPKKVKLLFFFAYQALIWNEVLSRIIKKFCKSSFQILFVKRRKITFYKEREKSLEPYLCFKLPFVSSNIFNEDIPEEIKEIFFSVLNEEIEQLGIEDIRDFLEAEALSLKVFSPGKRRIIVFPERLQIIEEKRDLIRFKFFLPSGSYATILLYFIFYC